MSVKLCQVLCCVFVCFLYVECVHLINPWTSVEAWLLDYMFSDTLFLGGEGVYLPGLHHGRLSNQLYCKFWLPY